MTFLVSTSSSSERSTGPAGINHWTSARQTNARVEGFNLKAKLVKRRAYGTALPENRSLGDQLQTQTRSVFQNRMPAEASLFEKTHHGVRRAARAGARGSGD